MYVRLLRDGSTCVSGGERSRGGGPNTANGVQSQSSKPLISFPSGRLAPPALDCFILHGVRGATNDTLATPTCPNLGFPWWCTGGEGCCSSEHELGCGRTFAGQSDPSHQEIARDQQLS